ncbi:CLUMA_CG011779, isoform A [Clunio marinus]|uniref:CLUMA_CG011779, isoform A n=1 Tax=Clunio marinus TaxID=568069 RepID=A0A1J1IDT8_9DIPT|nr:CLUMA_CG011779, isoform A [Clunio marinus]
MDYSNYKSWHIPRASLSSGSSSGQSSTESTRNLNRHKSDFISHNNRRLWKPFNEGSLAFHSPNSSSASSVNSKTQNQIDRRISTGNLEKLHRASKSSQGSSSEGINSLHSSSSLLLSVSNLENFTKMQERRPQTIKHELTQHSQSQFMLNIKEAVTPHQQKAKDFDQVSIASSNHFTVVNGFGRSNIKPKSNSFCRQGREITILIVTMSLLFMIGILGAIYLMDSKL